MVLLFLTLKNPFEPDGPFGGAESSIKQIAIGLANKGHRAVYVTHRATKQSRVVARSQGVKLLSVPFYLGNKGWKRKLFTIFFCTALWLIAIQKRVQSLYCYYETFGMVSVRFLGSFCPKVTLTVRIAGLSWVHVQERSEWHRLLFKEGFERAHQLNYIHPALKPVTERVFQERNIDTRKANSFSGDIGIPASELEKFRLHLCAKREHFSIVVPTRFSRPKRQDLIVRALATLPEYFKWRVVFVGEGKEKSEIEEMSHRLLPSGKFSFVGFLAQDELWALIARSDAVILPSDYEGLSKVTLESMTIGTPVLVSDVIPFNQYVVDGVNGFLVENTVKAWAKAIAEIVLQDANRLKAVSERARLWVLNSYALEQNLDLFERHLTTRESRVA